MADDTLPDLLRRAHGGEVLGAALFATLVGSTPDPDERRKLAACQLLEEQTATTIAGLAADHGVALDESADQADAGRHGAEALAAMTWTAKMAAIADGTGVYRSLYPELREALPDPGEPRMAEIVAHEQALSGFARAEAAGDAAALDVLLAALSPATRARLDEVARPH